MKAQEGSDPTPKIIINTPHCMIETTININGHNVFIRGLGPTPLIAQEMFYFTIQSLMNQLPQKEQR